MYFKRYWVGEYNDAAPAQTYECPFSKNRYSTRNKTKRTLKPTTIFFKNEPEGYTIN
jgi:hypothetical protein